MAAIQELPLVQKVQLRQKYQVTEGSKAKLLQAGAECINKVIHTEHYYDTASDELATAQLWLSQRDQQWCLLVDSQEQAAREHIPSSVPRIWKPPCQNRAENAQKGKPIAYQDSQEKKLVQLQPLNSQNDEQQCVLNKTDEASACAKLSSTYTEVVGEHEIIALLADFLHVDLTSKEGNVTMEDFLQQAGIQYYGSNHTVQETTYQLCNQYTVIIQSDENSLKESATVLLDVDVLGTCKGFEDMEKLADYLEFEPQDSSMGHKQKPFVLK